jgi:hypothetical protein
MQRQCTEQARRVSKRGVRQREQLLTASRSHVSGGSVGHVWRWDGAVRRSYLLLASCAVSC